MDLCGRNIIKSTDKGIVSAKNDNLLKMNSPSLAIQDVDEFVFSSEQIWRNFALHHSLTNGSSVSEWVPSEWESLQWFKVKLP